MNPEGAVHRKASVQKPRKEDILEGLQDPGASALEKYRSFFLGDGSLFDLVKYEVVGWLASPAPGALGYLLRKHLYPLVCAEVGPGVQFGRNVQLRHPAKIRIGAGTAVDDGCVLDARGAGKNGFRIGEDVLVARDSILQAKTGDLHVGDDCVIGPQCYLGSASHIEIGRGVLISGQCYIGGGRYRSDKGAPRFADQTAYSSGPVSVGDDVWIGAGARILDGVTIGRGSVIGAGAVVQRDVPEDTIFSPHQKAVFLPRGEAVDGASEGEEGRSDGR